MHFIFRNLFFVSSVLILLTACGGTGDESGTTETSNSPVFISGAIVSVSENITATSYTATATDADGDTVTFGLTGGIDQAKFYIDA